MTNSWKFRHVRLLKSYTIYLMNALNLRRMDQGASAMSSNEEKLTSAVQDPELDGWKKLSTVAISFARLSNALEPARYVFAFPCPTLPKGAER